MKFTAILLATVGLATAQISFTSGGGITCNGNPNGTYCAGDSLTTNIIIRCENGVGHPGNCNDNLSGYYPLGVNYAACWQQDATSGIAACSKNCIVECGSGSCEKSFNLPNCTPQSQSASSTLSTVVSTSCTESVPVSTTSSVGESTSSNIGTLTSISSSSVSSPTSVAVSTTSSLTITSTVTSICTTGGTISTVIYSTTYCPESSTTSAIGIATSMPSSVVVPTSTVTASTISATTYPLSTGTGSPSSTASNGTAVTQSGSPTPVGPTGTASASPSTYTGAAMANSAGAGLAVVGLFIAYFL